MVFLRFPQMDKTGNVRHWFCHVVLWQCWGSNIKSAFPNRKASKWNYRNVGAIWSRSERSYLSFFLKLFELRPEGKCKGVWIWAFHCCPAVKQIWIANEESSWGTETAPQRRASSLSDDKAKQNKPQIKYMTLWNHLMRKQNTKIFKNINKYM